MKYLIHVTTDFVGYDNTYSAEIDSPEDLEQLEILAYELAVENLLSYFDEEDLLNESGYDYEEMSDEEWDYLMSNINYNDFCSYSIEECTDEEEWESYDKV